MGSASTITPPIISSINHANPRHSSLRISVNRTFQLQLRVRLFSRERKSNLVARRINCSTVEVENGLEDETCELVNGKELSIGEVQAYLFQAVKNNNRIGILLLSDIFGFEDSATRDFAYRVACNGYNVLVPDLFQGDPWSKHRPKEDLERWIAEQDPERVARDVDTATKWMVEEFLEPKSETETKKKKLGVIGFCYGGGRVVEALGRDEEGAFGTGVSFYGTRIDLSSASKVKVPVLFVAGDGDPLCPVDLVEGLEKSVGRGSRSVVFKGRGHGFVHRPSSAEEDCDAEEAFLITRNWLQDRLAVLEPNS